MAARGDGAYVRVTGTRRQRRGVPRRARQPPRVPAPPPPAGGRRSRLADDRRRADAVPFWLEERGVRVGDRRRRARRRARRRPAPVRGPGVGARARQHPALALASLPPTRDPAPRRAGLGGRARRRVRASSRARRTGQPRMTAGLGRPLVLTPLEPAEAMRVLASESRTSVLVATGPARRGRGRRGRCGRGVRGRRVSRGHRRPQPRSTGSAGR